MKTSVIIPTYNGAHKIPKILQCLQQQTLRPFEVIVAIDGSTDNTADVIKPYEGFFDSFKVVRQNNSGRSVIRNCGAGVAQGDVLIFYDDDMEPEAQSIDKHVDFHLKHVGLLAGNSVELTDSEKTDIQNYKAFLTRVWTEKYQDGLNNLKEENLFFTAANCSIRREVFFKLRGFDERLTDAEDFDLGRRGLASGMPVWFDKKNTAIHHDPITCGSYIRRIRQYQGAQKKLMELHPERRKVSDPISGVASLVYRLFAFGAFPFLIDHFNVFLVLPRKVRYRFYDVIIHSMGVVHPQVRLW